MMFLRSNGPQRTRVPTNAGLTAIMYSSKSLRARIKSDRLSHDRAWGESEGKDRNGCRDTPRDFGSLWLGCSTDVHCAIASRRDTSVAHTRTFVVSIGIREKLAALSQAKDVQLGAWEMVD